MAEQLLRLAAVLERTSLSRSTVYDRIAAGTFPRPVPLGPGCVRWVESEVEAWIADLKAQRDAACVDGDGGRREAA